MTKSAKLLACCFIAAAALPLAACGPDRVVTASIVPDDYRIRHPVVIAEAPHVLDVFVSGANGTGSIDARSASDIRAFAATYRTRGRGQIVVLLPQGSGADAAARLAVPSIRRALVEGGARGAVSVGTYPVRDPSLAAPIRLTFEGLKAQVASICGQWPRDLVSGSTVDGWDNQPYWNMGCATQQTLAAQIDDPRDLVSGRAESPSDVQLRTRAIGALRKGEDPGVIWRTGNTSIGTIGGGN